jgi:hypothetical protein
MRNIVEKLYTKYSFFVAFVFSLIITFFIRLLFNYNDENIQIGRTSLTELFLFIFNILCISCFTIIYIKSIEKNNKRNIVVSVLIFFGFLMNVLGTIDYIFSEMTFLKLLGLLNLIPAYFILSFSFFLDNLLPINSDVFFPNSITYFLYIFINNILILILFKFLIFRKDNKPILLTLYFMQSNISIINVISFIAFWLH